MRPDQRAVAGLVPPNSRVLDLGCGDGELLAWLMRERGCTGHGVERSDEGFHACVARGVPVTQAEIEAELPRLEDGAFDCALLSWMLPATRRPAQVLREIARIAPRRVVSVPNRAHWRARAQLLVRGTVPAEPSWHASPNLHPGSLRDFEALVDELGQRAEHRTVIPARARRRPNLLAGAAIYVLGDRAEASSGRRSSSRS